MFFKIFERSKNLEININHSFLTTLSYVKITTDTGLAGSYAALHGSF
jgi:hypothetical protein